MNYASVCSGIEAATVAWHPLGWRPQFFAEVAPFPCAVLAHHYPDVPNRGDFTRFHEWPDTTFDVLVGGTPCQSFSIAGLRKGLDDPRGGLALAFGRLVERYCPRWLVWENVPGVLSSNGGRDFGTFLGMLVEFGYGVAYRVFDARYFNVPQRRRRVFVVGCLGSWGRATAVLFDAESLSWRPAPRRQTREGNTAADAASVGTRGGGLIYAPPFANSLTARMTKGINTTLDEGQTLVATEAGVRLLTPRECERVQGFPDDYTLVPWRNGLASDGPRYRALGNSMAVPVMRWIGKRIQFVSELMP